MVVWVEDEGERPRLAGDESNDVPNWDRLMIDPKLRYRAGYNVLRRDHSIETPKGLLSNSASDLRLLLF